jgi:dTDP-4-amino-4,6-dideoxygalactose transaminase
MTFRIWLSPPHLLGTELPYIQEAIRTNHVSSFGPNIDGFKKVLSNYINVQKQQIALTNTGTSALHLALKTMGVSEGDYVICQSNSFIATANCILYLNAIPVFIDSEPHSWNMCPDLLEEALMDLQKKGIKPKALITVDLYGMPCDYERIIRLTDNYNIPIIEDSAEALGSTYKHMKCGTLTEAGVFSFNTNKIITTSGGGALISKHPNILDKANYLAQQAKSDKAYYWHEELGYNYSFSNILAGIGLAQMQQLDFFVEERRRVFDFYKQRFYDETPSFGVDYQKEWGAARSNRWLSCFLFNSTDTKEKVFEALRQKGIECRNLWTPIHKQPLYKGCHKYLNGVSEDLFTRGLCLPSGTHLTTFELEEIADLVTQQLV